MRFNKNHACFQGHFDHQPIVPGAYLLSLAIDYIYQTHPTITSLQVIQAKFPQSLTPETHYEWQLTEQKPGIYIIRAKNDSQLFLQARLKGELR
ncbi:hypothetical protein [Piscirickettsia litoralis]|uniref:ApeI dehydratase-like domain-containing protein n=1 Tax=Piscirickettsia litoralis TaxID=1891921 RepID=A0ABX3A1L3_9GAMM|nr:hypothetical protein [Piscirickettsia litoralis]ODN42747.1 hypothetical protein BGC07_07200 [Piscirickettsia litoralis]